VPVSTSTACHRNSCLRTVCRWLPLFPFAFLEVSAYSVHRQARLPSLARALTDFFCASLLCAGLNGANRHVPCASPDYLASHGVPRHPRDLERFDLIALGTGASSVHE
jgi:hypothetical protein